ncbi:hypothetical protein B0T21DRAFT_415431 [Apiosordaria backusii]|uniref:DUF7600 domain-containing protein n=1 Tax=Apiosordaria backusii TaxID=314023 RepID=A0AA40DX06_9PEZI|nr:hypothetical protein B0T21DRAFT_415431 [Apiosordaria backusii]
MSPYVIACAICGWRIFETGAGWRNEFRGLCITPTNDKVNLTGVGLYDDPSGGGFIAPRDPNGRYDDEGYKRPSEDDFSVHRGSSNPLFDLDPNQRRGFAIHDVCWRLLQQALSPSPIALDRVFCVLDSIIDIHGLTKPKWNYASDGHEDSYFPWNLCGGLWEAQDAPWSADPIEVNVQKLLSATMLTEKHPAVPKVDTMASRFTSPNGELSWFYEVHFDTNQGLRDWQLLCQLLTAEKNTLLTPLARRGLENRRHIWSRIANLAPIIMLECHETEQPLKSPWAITGQDFPRDRWKMVAGSLEGKPGFSLTMRSSCRQLQRYKFSLPEDISRVSVSTVVVGYFTYICGLSLSTLSGQTLRVGYSNLNHGNTEQTTHLEPWALTGLNIAVGKSGIHALQCVGPRGPVGDWLGRPGGNPKIRRLGSATGMVALEVGFDGFRLVSIAAVLKDSDREDGHEENDYKLRTSAVWFPELPSTGVNINANFFPHIKSYSQGFNPLIWNRFGGPGGAYLGNLIKISFDGEVIVFQYTRGTIPLESRVFGRPLPPDEDQDDDQDMAHDDDDEMDIDEGDEEDDEGDEEDDEGDEEDDEGDEEDDEDNTDESITETFDIDGPGGERIIAIEVSQHYDPTSRGWRKTDGVVGYIKLYTNYGRSCSFVINDCLQRRWVEEKRTLSAPPGTAITGIYGGLRDTTPVAVGVITEAV